jgi:hypothetical protein
MTASEACRITVDLEPEGPPIQGSLRSGSEPSHRFTGWIGLLAALETAIDLALFRAKEGGKEWPD